ncbi:MAG: class 1 isoprenoid biosynthesis enzyme [Ferruginibacter sp.]|nr:class 1 isoprenoid biosynthesis enzyme [Chitinophagaceae bacterium]
MNVPALFGNMFSVPGTASALLRSRKTQQLFLRENILPLLQEAEQSNDGTLEASDFKKITGYYGLAIPAIVGDSFATLRGKKLTTKERLALSYLGTITGLFDDFFDKHQLEDEKIRALLEQPDSLTGQNSSEKLFLDCYRKALGQAHDPQLVLHYFRKVYDAQIESKKQAQPGLTEEEILRITLHKGAVSVLFYRAAMEHPFLPGEEDAIYKMGGLMQFGNDIFDIYKDRNGGIHTLLTTTKKIDRVRSLFREVMEESFTSISGLGYSSGNIKEYLRIFSLALCSRCFVCLDQLESKEQLTGNLFSPGEYSRQDLICDMEKTGNRWKSLVYHLNERIRIPETQKIS